MATAASLPYPALLTAFLLVLQIGLALSYTSFCNLVPSTFACTKPITAQSAIYSNAAAPYIKVDLIHILCGDVDRRGNAGGFHARPGNVDPDSARTSNSQLLRRPENAYDFAVYNKPEIWRNAGANSDYVAKRAPSGIWPTALSYEGIVWTITYLVNQCSPGDQNLCVRGVSLLANSKHTTVPTFDVVIIIQSKPSVGRIVRTAFPADSGSCNLPKYSSFKKCQFQFPTTHPSNLVVP